MVSPLGVGYANTPGICSAAQVEGRKLTTRAVRGAGGRIVLLEQLLQDKRNHRSGEYGGSIENPVGLRLALPPG